MNTKMKSEQGFSLLKQDLTKVSLFPSEAEESELRREIERIGKLDISELKDDRERNIWYGQSMVI